MNNLRPKTPTVEMKLEAAGSIVADLISDGYLSEDTKDESAKDLAKMSRNADGYEIAKELDSWHHWDCSKEMIDYLDNYGYAVSKLVEKAEAEWAKQNNIQPPVPVGERVSFGEETGVITGISEWGAAKYLVARDDDPEAHTETHRRRIVNFEDVQATA